MPAAAARASTSERRGSGNAHACPRTPSAMIDFSRNHFELFGMPERFAVDADALERSYRALQSENPSRPLRRRGRNRSAGSRCSRRRASTKPTGRCAIRWTARSICCRCTASTRWPRTAPRSHSSFSNGSSSGARPRAKRRRRATRRRWNDCWPTCAPSPPRSSSRLAALLDGEAAWDTARARVRELKFLGKLAADIDDMLGELES